MFLDLFYKLGASIVIVISLLAVKSTGIGEELSIRKTNALLMLSGCVTSVFFYVSIVIPNTQLFTLCVL